MNSVLNNNNNKKYSLISKNTQNNNQEFKNLNTNYIKEKLAVEWKDEEKIDFSEKNQHINYLKRTFNNIEIIKNSEKNDNLLINKNGYTLSNYSGQGESNNNYGNIRDNNRKQSIKHSQMNNENQNQNQTNNKKIVDPSQIYLTPTQKIYKTLNENMIFFNKYYSKKK